ncbi:MAG TPA: DUF294 nucleotidyltransferase-like domain-containing protein [Thiobacillaceae bacterium]|nr:DUF294 nucleotidyltransferase-like domain-containing protein [Thiobacillaceae bacterium]HNU63883.1 DUF294 nucleotidyltransferase-like domain-containing protein [Thiobacillaceae bacterium]
MPAANTLIAATVEHLSRFAPFDAMDRGHLVWLAQRLRLAYFARDEVLLAPHDGEVRRLYIVKQGEVYGEQDGEDAWVMLHEGECFPIGALLGRRPVISVFRAQGDVFAHVLDATDFHQLVRDSEPFRDFCTRRLASLLEQSQRQLHATYATNTAQQQSLRSPLAGIPRRAPVTCGPDTPLREALETIQESAVGSIVVVDAGQVPLGIFTVRDLIGRVILPATDLDTPMRRLMTPNPVTLPARAHAFEAAMHMARDGFRHVLVEEEGRLSGVISEKDLFSLQRVGVTQLSSTIRAATGLDVLVRCAADIHELGHNMMAQGVAAEQLTQILSTLNDLLTQRVIELESARAGQPAFCWLAFGSEGRREQTLSTDQDNGMLFQTDPGETADQARARLLPMAERINRALDACGFPLCQGGIMAMNPRWCLSLEEWQAAFARWIDSGDPRALHDAGIFFDLRALHDPAQLATALRQWLLARIAATPRFLRRMAANALSNRPPLGLVRDFVVDGEGEEANTLDLKLNGLIPFVDAARVFALAAGVAASGTADRLRGTRARLGIPEAEVEAWISAFFFIQMLRLRGQQGKRASGLALRNRIDPDQLNDLDRRILKESFRQARKVQNRLALGYPA